MKCFFVFSALEKCHIICSCTCKVMACNGVVNTPDVHGLLELSLFHYLKYVMYVISYICVYMYDGRLPKISQHGQ